MSFKFERPLVRFPEDEPGSSFEELITNEQAARQKFELIQSSLHEIGATLEKNMKLLELGTGTGELLKYFSQQDYDIAGIDARPRHGKNLPIAAARIERMPFKDATFDAVISSAIFDADFYVQHQGMMRDEIIRVLKPGGRYIALFSSGFDIQGLQTDKQSQTGDIALYHK